MPRKSSKPRYDFTVEPGTNKISIVGEAYIKCAKCGHMVPMADFGLRNMGNGTVRNQPRCGVCRGAP